MLCMYLYAPSTCLYIFWKYFMSFSSPCPSLTPILSFTLLLLFYMKVTYGAENKNVQFKYTLVWITLLEENICLLVLTLRLCVAAVCRCVNVNWERLGIHITCSLVTDWTRTSNLMYMCGGDAKAANGIVVVSYAGMYEWMNESYIITFSISFFSIGIDAKTKCD